MVDVMDTSLEIMMQILFRTFKANTDYQMKLTYALGISYLVCMYLQLQINWGPYINYMRNTVLRAQGLAVMIPFEFIKDKIERDSKTPIT